MSHTLLLLQKTSELYVTTTVLVSYVTVKMFDIFYFSDAIFLVAFLALWTGALFGLTAETQDMSSWSVTTTVV